MHEQTRGIVSRMKLAGVPRGRYSVRTPAGRNGEYGDPQIACFMTVDEFLEYLPGLVGSEFGVTLYYFLGLVRGYAIDWKPPAGRPHLWVDNLDARRYAMATATR